MEPAGATAEASISRHMEGRGNPAADDLLGLARATADDGQQRGVGAASPTELEHAARPGTRPHRRTPRRRPHPVRTALAVESGANGRESPDTRGSRVRIRAAL